MVQFPAVVAGVTVTASASAAGASAAAHATAPVNTVATWKDLFISFSAFRGPGERKRIKCWGRGRLAGAAAATAGWEPVHLPEGIPDTADADFMLTTLVTTGTLLTGYDNNASYWRFTSQNGCDTRNRVLRAQAVQSTEFPGAIALQPPNSATSLCPVTAGSWQRPYDPFDTPLNLSDSAIGTNIEIDHIVPKANAWATGAGQWTSIYGQAAGQAYLSLFANDLGVPELLAVSASSNASKGDLSPELWMPNNPGMTCPYIKAWIAVKFEYNLKISTVVTTASGQSEASFLKSTLAGC